MTHKLTPRVRRRFLVVLLATCCAALTSLGIFSSKANSRLSAIRAIDERHGTYGVKLVGPSWVRTVVTTLGGDKKLFYNPLRVSLGPYNQGYDPSRPIGDSDLKVLGEHFAALPDLEVLDLSACDVSDEGIASLPALPALKVLMLARTRVTNGFTTSLSKFPLLAEIWLQQTAVTEQGVAEIQRSCNGCTVKQ